MIRVLTMANATADIPAARRAKRQFLARRRCLRALRTTLASLLLYEPFAYCGLVLSCHAPFDLGNFAWANATAFLVLAFLRSLVVCIREMRHAPLLAMLPMLIYLTLAIATRHADPWRYNLDYYFRQFYADRLDVIKRVQSGELPDYTLDVGIEKLPPALAHTSYPSGNIGYTNDEDGLTLYFFADGQPPSKARFVYNEKFTPENITYDDGTHKSISMGPGWALLEY
ncbi:hypothetical membrane protein [Solidesulfovibrio magneticus RS-1]|uniref:Hypothetical membrane protein n=2 Tax=Solidesulfovibrio TaxID=2910984 RepID=C4XL79_SOLM1|nr:hypothetical membrane protein [Solidesulfovibrio magneticus RS-1]